MKRRYRKLTLRQKPEECENVYAWLVLYTQKEFRNKIKNVGSNDFVCGYCWIVLSNNFDSVLSHSIGSHLSDE